MEHGTVKLHWLDVVMQVQGEDDVYRQSLQSAVFAKCAEHANRLSEWPHLSSLAKRVDPWCWEAVSLIIER